MGSGSAAQRMGTSTTGSRRGRHRASNERRLQTYPWLGAGAVSLGIGAAALTGSGVAQAEGKSSESSSEITSSPANGLTGGVADASDNGDGRSEVTKRSPKRHPAASRPARSTTAAGEATRSDGSAESERNRAGETDALEDVSTELESTTVATATATERRGLSADADASTPFARFRALTQADAEQDGSGSRDSLAVEAETRSGVVNLDKSEATTQALPRRVLSAAAADEPESQGQAWLEQRLFNKTPTVSFVAGTTTSLPDGSIRGAVQGDDADGDVLTYTAGRPTNGGTVAISSSDGTFVYTPGAGSAPDGTDTFSVTVSDDVDGSHVHGVLGLLIPGWGSTATTTVSIGSSPTPIGGSPSPIGGSPRTAAERYGWGTPIDETTFSDSSAFSNGWSVYNSPGHSGYGRRTPAAISFSDNAMIITGDAAGNTGGLEWMPGQQYGAWEVRVRVPQGAADYHAVALLWPDAENWPTGGEIDFLEIIGDSSRQRVGHFLHYSAQNRAESAFSQVDATQWHNYAVSWTPQAITMYIDSAPVFTTTDTSKFPPGPMHLAIQLDASRSAPSA